MDQEVRAGLHYARRLDVRVRKRVAQEPRSLPRRAGRQCRRSGVRGRRRVHRATNRDGRAAAHPRVSLSAEQLVHRVPGRPHGAGRGPRNLRRPRTPRGNGLRPARRCRRARARPAAQAGYSSTGLTDETVHVVFAQVEKVADAQPEPAEFIEPFLLPIADVPRFLAENETPIGTRAQLVLEAFARRR